eukprot:884400-Pyramimonas_sp.AAC.1
MTKTTVAVVVATSAAIVVFVVIVAIAITIVNRVAIVIVIGSFCSLSEISLVVIVSSPDLARGRGEDRGGSREGRPTAS